MDSDALKLSAVAVVRIESAQQLWSSVPDTMRAAAERFEHACASLLEPHGGRRARSPGADFIAAFDDCVAALGWCLDLQTQLLAIDWPERLLEQPAASETRRDGTIIHRGLRANIGLDLGVLHARIDGLSGAQLARGEVVESARDAAERGASGHITLSPACADVLSNSDIVDRFFAADEPGPWLSVVPSELRARAAAHRATRAARHNLPGFSGAFIRRAHEWEKMREAVARARLVHLYGASGAGKTRLAVEFAAAWLDRQPAAQAWFCELADVSQMSDALLEIARTTGVQIPRSESLEELESRLVSAWSARGQVMVVLDDMGDVMPEMSRAIADWTEHVDTLCVVSTAREPTDSLDSVVSVDALGRASAVALLRDRLAHSAQPEPIDVDIAELNRAVEDCGRLPLALELFAGSARRMQTGELAESSVGTIGSEARLDRALVRSWEALTPAEQSALRACTVFAGNFSADAAVAVIESLSADIEADEILQSLRHQSLVRSDGVSHGVKRLILLAPVRDFIEQRLDSVGRAQVEDAHQAFYTDWSRQLAEGLAGRDEPLWIGRARDDLGNLYRAADHARAGDVGSAVDIMEALASLDKRIGSLGGFLERTQSLVDAVSESDDAALIYRALKIRAGTYLWAGDYEGAEDDYRSMLELAEHGDDPRRLAYAQSGLGFTLGTLGHEEEALPLVREAIDAYADDDSYDAITVLTNAAIMVRHRNQIEETVDYLHRALSRARQRESIFGQASVLMLMGSTLLYDEQYDEAIRYLEEADELFERIGDRRGQVVVYHELGRCYDAVGRVDACDACYQKAMELASAVGDREYVAISWLGRGRARFRRGEYVQAESDLLEASIMLGNHSQVHLKLGALLRLAATYGALERLSEAKNYFERVEAVFQDTDVTRERPTYEVLYGFLEYARARKAMRLGDEDLAEELVRAAWQRIDDARSDEDHSHATERSTARLEAFLQKKTEAGDIPPIDRGDTTMLRVDRELSWFQVRSQEPVDIRRRGAARRILGALVDQRIEQPGDALSTQELVDIGWPDEVLVPESGARRIYMTISRMRDMGLEDVIETVDDGYRIAPDVHAVWVD